jgi:acetolactate synthase-1/3 small subunit
VFRAKVLDISPVSIAVEVTGAHDKVEAFLELARPHGILELVRTGVAGLSRGADTL